MYSTSPDTLLAAVNPVRMALPMVEGRIPAGFPSPAGDFDLKCLDLNDLLITHPLATFFWQVSGWSMVNEHIGDGDILVVNRALAPQHGNIVVAQVDNQFTVKILHLQGGCVKLVAANPDFEEITFGEFQELVIVGVVTASIRQRLTHRSVAAQHKTRDAKSGGM